MEITKVYSNNIKVVDYPTRGKGINCAIPIAKGTTIGIYLSKDLDPISEGRVLYDGWIESKLLGRYANHNSEGNCDVKMVGNDIFLISNQDIKSYHEITLNYIDVAKLTNLPLDQYTKYGIKDFNYAPVNVVKTSSLI